MGDLRETAIATDAYEAIRPIGGKFWHELDDMTRTLAICAARNALARIEALEAGLRTAFEAIDSLPNDALGTGGDGRGNEWPLREELLHNLHSLLSGWE